MKTFISVFACTIVIAILASTSSAQVATGTPPFGSFGGGPFDVVNLGSLNAHFAIRVRQKAGRVTPFTYDIGYDTSVWYPVTSGSTKSWQPVSGYGWNYPGPAGTVTNKVVSTQQMPCSPPGDMHLITQIVYAFYVFTDGAGGTHPFNTSYAWYSQYGCATSGQPPAPWTTTASDGSGYVLTLPASTVAGPDGRVFAGNNTTDANGNQITVDANGNYTDTLGTAALSITGTYPKYLQYAAPNGGTATWTINYTTYTVQTNFGCSGIGGNTARTTFP